MKTTRLALVCLFLLLGAFQLRAQPPTGMVEKLSPALYYQPGPEIFVATNGLDQTGNGSFEKPFRTILHALEQADSGAVITLRNGVYEEAAEVRIRRSAITIRSRQGRTQRYLFRRNTAGLGGG